MGFGLVAACRNPESSFAVVCRQHFVTSLIDSGVLSQSGRGIPTSLRCGWY